MTPKQKANAWKKADWYKKYLTGSKWRGIEQTSGPFCCSRKVDNILHLNMRVFKWAQKGVARWILGMVGVATANKCKLGVAVDHSPYVRQIYDLGCYKLECRTHTSLTTYHSVKLMARSAVRRVLSLTPRLILRSLLSKHSRRRPILRRA